MARPMTSIRPMFSFLMLWYSLCGWKIPSGNSSLVRLLRSARSRMNPSVYIVVQDRRHGIVRCAVRFCQNTDTLSL